jgi:hypothetical protein
MLAIGRAEATAREQRQLDRVEEVRPHDLHVHVPAPAAVNDNRIGPLTV